MQQLSNLPDNNSNVDTTDILTKDMLIGTLPDKRFKRAVTDELIDLVNSEPEGEVRRIYRDNILSFSSVLMKGRYSLTAYVNAVKFVSLQLMGDTTSSAYGKVFPDRYNSLIMKGTSTSQIASYADSYSKNSLIIKILEQTIIPTHILNAGVYQEAINTQADLMRNANSEMVKQKAAECLISNLKAPETAKVEIDVNYSNDIVDDLRSTTRMLAKQQAELISSGMANAKEVAHSTIISNKLPVVDVADEEEESEITDSETMRDGDLDLDPVEVDNVSKKREVNSSSLKGDIWGSVFK